MNLVVEATSRSRHRHAPVGSYHCQKETGTPRKTTSEGPIQTQIPHASIVGLEFLLENGVLGIAHAPVYTQAEHLGALGDICTAPVISAAKASPARKTLADFLPLLMTIRGACPAHEVCTSMGHLRPTGNASSGPSKPLKLSTAITTGAFSTFILSSGLPGQLLCSSTKPLVVRPNLSFALHHLNCACAVPSILKRRRTPIAPPPSGSVLPCMCPGPGGLLSIL